MSKLIGVHWFTQGAAPHHFGIVVIKTLTGEKKAYIGVISGHSEDRDIKNILEWGAKIFPEQLEIILDQLKKES